MRTGRHGFTLVELAVVVVIIGVLAAFAVPRFLTSVERSKAAEAFNFLSTVQAAQERYHAREADEGRLWAASSLGMAAARFMALGIAGSPSLLCERQ